MSLGLVIFDCDGVLVDTETLTDQVIAAELTRYGLPRTPQQIGPMFRGGTMEGVMNTAREMGADLPDGWLDQVYGLMFAALAKGVDVIDGVVDVLDLLEAQGVQIAVASNGPMAKMAVSLGPSGLWDRLLGRIYSREDHAPKPAPDMLLHAMKVAGVGPADTVMIDDMDAGAKAAQAAGVRCLGFGDDGDPARFDGTGATYVRDMAAVRAALGLG